MREVSWKIVPRVRVVVWGGYDILGGMGRGSWKPETREPIVAGPWNISAERVDVCLGVT